MATDTLHYHLKKPASADRVAVGDLNDNSDTIDGYLYQANERADQLADDYNASSTYNTGDYTRRENYIYKCNADNTTGTWDDTKWDRVKVMDEITQGGGGGSSTLAGLNDVSLATPTDGQLLGYNGTSHKWENVNGGGGGSSTFAGLNDVNVQGVSNGDIARFNSSTNKWEKSSDLTDLELSVSQLSSSVLSIAWDVDALELTVSQMSASTLPYDANTSTKQKIDNVESSIPTSASDLPYSSGVSTKQKIDALYDNDRKVVFGGNYIAEAQSSGRIKITQPFYNYQNWTSVSLNTSVVYAGLYGTKSAVGVNITVYSVNIRDNAYVEIIFDLPSGYSLSTYTDLSKGFLLEIPQIIATLS